MARISIYSENKKRRNVTLTDDAWEKLNKMAIAKKLSVSEFLERFARRIIPRD